MYNKTKLLTLLGSVALSSGCALKETGASSPALGDGKDDGSRNMYSPNIYGDASTRQQWIAGIEALETQCRTTGEYCKEAQDARKSLRNHISGFTHPAR